MNIHHEQDILKRNAELEKVLAAKNHELEIEAALEQVRAVAMAMRKADDLMLISEVIYKQLLVLGFSNVRNVQIAIDDDEKQLYNGVEYSEYYQNRLVEVPYDSSPMFREIVNELKKSDNAFYQKEIKGKDFKDWRKWRMSIDTKNHPDIASATSMCFYLHSVGAGMLGISTFNAITNDQLEILKRLRNVFELSYKRYVDIEKAEAQAREAQIEAALEKVRGRAMAMYKSEELLEAGALLYSELSKLGIEKLASGYMLIDEDEKMGWNYGINPTNGQIISQPVGVPLTETKEIRSIIEAWKKQEPVHVLQLDPGETIMHQSYMADHTINFPISKEKLLSITPERLVIHAFNFKQGYLIIVRGEVLSVEQQEMVVRFAKVFEMTYRRFLDLQKAEAQVRESHIQLALERVRARTMAMQKSDELQDAAILLFQQIRSLGVQTGSCGFNIWNKKEKTATVWMSSPEGGLQDPFDMPLSEGPIYRPVDAALKKGDEFLVKEVEGKNLVKHFDYLMTLPGIGETIKHLRKTGYVFPKRMIYHFAFFNKGYLSFHTHEPYPEAHDIFKRFAKVFEQTYTRFLDLQKAEAQTREAQIELGLERVRARAMAMQKSDELSELVDTVFKELTKLDFALTWCIINIIDEPSLSNTVWAANPDITKAPESYHMLFEDYPFHHAMMKGWKERNTKSVYTLEGDEKRIYDDYLFSETEFRRTPEAAQAASRAMEKYVVSFSFSNFGGLQTVGDVPLSEANLDILSRFGKVFDLTYTRFNDLKQAEAQAREAKIEAALERVRSRTMAMFKSDELAETAVVLFKQMIGLGIQPNRLYIAIINDNSGDLEFWITDENGDKVSSRYMVNINKNISIKKMYEGWTAKKKTITIDMQGKELEDWLTYWREEFHVPFKPGAALKRRIQNIAYFSKGFIAIASPDDQPESTINLLERFAAVFNLTYTRFSDLQQAEAQARGSQIQLALERVRARTMAMQKSNELQEVVNSVYERLNELKVGMDGAAICTFIEGTKDYNVWIGDYQEPLRIKFNEFTQVQRDYNDAIERREELFTNTYYGEIKKEYIQFLLEQTVLGINIPEEQKQLLLASAFFTTSLACTKNTVFQLYRYTEKSFSKEENDILKRFANVFEQSYTRFLDLQKAEAQARESQIQLALERVRARTMAMQKSDELAEAASLLFTQIADLGTNSWSSGFIIFQPDELSINSWMSKPDGSMGVPFNIPVTEDPFFIKIYEAYKRGEEFFVMESGGKELEETYRYMFGLPGAAKALGAIEGIGFQMPTFQITHCTFFHQGFLMFITYESCPEMWGIFKRFGKVFEQTYTRFLDLQKAEAQARESQIQLALERVRARTMAMQRSDELKNAAALLFQQVKSLGAPAYSCGYNIWEKDDKEFTSWMSTQDGSIINGVPNIPLTEDANFIRYVRSKHNGEQFFVLELRGERMQEHYEYLKTIPAFKAYFEYAISVGFDLPKTQIHHLANFSQGNLLFITLEPCPEFHDVFKRFAAVFEQTYTRFLDLQKAEAQARDSQIELALERVRARTMAMQKSDELREAVLVIYEQLQQLNFESKACNIIIIDKESGSAQYWVSGFSQEIYPESYYVPRLDHPYHEALLKPWRQGDKYVVYEYSGKMKQRFDEIFFTQTEFRNVPEDAKKVMIGLESVKLSTAFISYGALQALGAEPLSEENANILQRFAKVFEQTYTRFLDLQKAEAQAREAQIEAALEKVRSRSLAMHTANELGEVVTVIVEKLKDLGVVLDANGVILCTYFQHSKDVMHWIVSPDYSMAGSYLLPYFDHPIFSAAWQSKENGDEFFSKAFSVVEKNSFFEYAFEHSDYKYFPEDLKQWIFQNDKHILSFAWQRNSAILIPSHTGVLPTESDKAILIRFAKVFEQSYVRFLDLQKAEAQTREARIEAALERVRSRTMAMHRSDELPETSFLLFQQLKELGETTVQNSIGIVNEETGFVELSTTVLGHHLPHTLNVPIDDPYVMAKAVAAWKAKQKSLKVEVRGQELKDYNEHRNSFFETKVKFPEDQWIVNVIFFSKGWLSFSSDKEISGETFDLLKRFAAVFEQTYIRFNDLKQAEEQARESQVQLALERVRARTMAMQKSDELMETAVVLFDQLKQLGENIERTIIGVMNEEERVVDVWATRPDGSQMDKMQKFPIDEPILMQKVYGAWQQQKRSIVIDLQGEELEGYFQFLKSRSSRMKRENFGERRVENFAFFSKGMLGIISVDPNTPANVGLYERFAAVFDQTYTRFLDLQKSEAQAREAQIEAALERVRSRTMGMQKSDELKDVIQVVYEQFVHLNIHVEHTGFIMDYKERNDMHIWLADKHAVPFQVTIPYFDCAHWNSFNEAKEKGIDFFANKLLFEEKNKFYQDLFKLIPDLPEETLKYYFSCPGLAISTVLLDNVGLYIENFSGIPYSDEENNTLMRFGKVFQQTYTRFLDLQKAEAQAREAQIETSLERIRSRTMGMQKSNELKDVATLLNKELIHLGITNFASCGYIEIEEKSNRQHSWLTNPDGVSLEHFFLPLTGEHIFDERYDAWKRKEVVFKQVVHAKELKKHLDFAYSGFGSQESENIGRNFFPDPTIFYSCNFSYGYLSLITGVMLSQAEELLLARFTRVFEQTYSRFLDLQKAEAQAREAKIEAALEKVRASTMAMQHSDHLSETAFVLFKQFKELGEAPERIFIATFDEEQQGIIDIWGTNQGGNQLNKLFKVSADEPTLIKKIIAAWKEKKRSVIIDLKGEELKQYISFLRSTGIPVTEGIMEERRVQTIGCFSKGVIGVTTPEPQSAESVQLLERFAGVFDLTYTRFLDLQQAEAQAREAKIEAALERVRSRTMAMQHSDELKDAALLLFQQVQSFGVDQWACGYNIWEADGKTCTAWMARQGALQPPFKTHPTVDHCFQRFYDAKQRGESFYVDEIGGEEIKTHYKRLISLPEFKSAPKEFFDEFIAPEFQIFHIAYFEQGYLMFITYKQVPETWDIFKRFAKVFEQTYTRFLDLQKAEAQAREAKIEAALEKVRSRTMAMQTSAELTDVAGLLFEQVSALGIKTWTAGFNVWSEDNNSYVDYITSPQGGFIEPYTVYTETAEALTDISNARKSGVEFDVQYVEGEKIKQLYLALTKLDEKQYEIMLQDGVRFPSHQYEHFVFGSKVSLMFITYEPVPEAHDIFKRLGKVFEQTYTRFLDLQKAEAQAREAIKQASVDRIRAEIASMRTTNDLERIQPLIWNELTTLGVPFTRCGVFIMDEEHEQVDTFLSTPDGKSIASFTSNYSDVSVISEALPYWRKKEIYKAHWDEATFLAQAQTLLSQGNITSTETYLTEHRPKDLYLHFLPFLQGILYVGNETPLNDDELQLVQNLADAFSIAYARYEDFNKLELAKEQIENTLTNLKQAQAQLVQSEKMASLGELTAGIAHEIQNPLNFVNNFSEVNTELIAEMKDEIEKGNIEEVKAIANDIADNEQKINHHGKRADAIVKGMLQHSRSSSGVKEPSDINVLADEYLRLAYHGLRAKDKSFNATMKTDYDETIGKINIVPQDIGRSVLNLITNAFYAVSEKKKQKAEGYEPTVTVTTKRINGKVEIRVADNGNGIPQKVLDKIFQPFFTTKPTGQGTGLGLSLSYDIVKAHGGEINMETREGEGSEFNIQLPS